MLIQINREHILNSWRFDLNKPSGTINGKKWQFVQKKQIANLLFKYVFVVKERNGNNLYNTVKTVIAGGDEDIRAMAEIAVLGNRTPDQYDYPD